MLLTLIVGGSGSERGAKIGVKEEAWCELTSQVAIHHTRCVYVCVRFCVKISKLEMESDG